VTPVNKKLELEISENYLQIKEDDWLCFAAFLSVQHHRLSGPVPNPDLIVNIFIFVQLFVKHFCLSACILIVVFCIFSFSFFECDNSLVSYIMSPQLVQRYLTCCLDRR
jgi:hypothetical protein